MRHSQDRLERKLLSLMLEHHRSRVAKPMRGKERVHAEPLALLNRLPDCVPRDVLYSHAITLWLATGRPPPHPLSAPSLAAPALQRTLLESAGLNSGYPLST